MAIGAVQSITYTGVNITFAAVAGFELIPGNYRRFVWIKNGGGVSTAITVSVPGSTFEQPNPDIVFNIAAGAEAMIGPIVPELNDPSASNSVVIAINPTASVTGAAVDLPTPPPDLP